MELAKIKNLLDKYLEGNTSLQEEQELKHYFTGSNVHPGLENYTSLFVYFSQEKKETFSNKLTLNKKKFNYKKWMSIASVFIIGFSMFSVYYYNSIQEQQQAELAYKETKKALQFLSVKLNQGTDKMMHLNQFEKTTNKIFKEK